VKFAREKVADVWEEIYPLMEAHWSETEMYRSGNKLNPDRERYTQFCEIGYYQLYTMRTDDGQLVGDIGTYLTRGMHDQRKLAIEDSMFIMPDHRKGWTAIKFVRYVEGELKKQGCEELYTTTKLGPVSKFMEFMGYKHVANQFWKVL